MILPYAYPTGSPEFMGGGEGGDTAHSFVFCEVFARSLFELYLFANQLRFPPPKTNRHDIIVILLKVALNTITLTHS